MNDKPKRGVMGWWQRTDPIDRPMYILMITLLAIVLLVGFVIISGSLSLGDQRRNTSCEELGHWKAEDLPARCYEYYGLTLVEVD